MGSEMCIRDRSYKLAEVTLTTPLKYLSLVFAIIFGFYFFDEFPSIHTLLGAGLIVISSAIIFVRENQLKKPIILPRQQWEELLYIGLSQKKLFQREHTIDNNAYKKFLEGKYLFDLKENSESIEKSQKILKEAQALIKPWKSNLR